MGFTTGFTGGVTLTLGIAYLTVLAHERNRQTQATALRSQSRVLNGLLEPTPLPPPQTRAELAREERSTLVETAKDRWNDEVENAVRWVQRTDWSEVREGMEGAVSRLLGGGLQKSREGIEEAEKRAGPKIQEAVDRSKTAARKGADEAAAGIDRAAAATIAGVERASAEAKEGASRIAASTRSNAEKGAASTKANAERAVSSSKQQIHEAGVKSAELKDATKVKADRAVSETKTGFQAASDSIQNSGGTVDAARGAVRDAISQGLEKGREVVDKVQAAVGLATAKIGSQAQTAGLGHGSPVEKAFHERYEKPNGLEKSVEQTLEERYKPIDARDNTILRGV